MTHTSLPLAGTGETARTLGPWIPAFAGKMNKLLIIIMIVWAEFLDYSFTVLIWIVGSMSV
jgi:hypothetical protein